MIPSWLVLMSVAGVAFCLLLQGKMARGEEEENGNFHQLYQAFPLGQSDIPVRDRHRKGLSNISGVPFPFQPNPDDLLRKALLSDKGHRPWHADNLPSLVVLSLSGNSRQHAGNVDRGSKSRGIKMRNFLEDSSHRGTNNFNVPSGAQKSDKLGQGLHRYLLFRETNPHRGRPSDFLNNDDSYHTENSELADENHVLSYSSYDDEDDDVDDDDNGDETGQKSSTVSDSTILQLTNRNEDGSHLIFAPSYARRNRGIISAPSGSISSRDQRSLRRLGLASLMQQTFPTLTSGGSLRRLGLASLMQQTFLALTSGGSKERLYTHENFGHVFDSVSHNLATIMAPKTFWGRKSLTGASKPDQRPGSGGFPRKETRSETSMSGETKDLDSNDVQALESIKDGTTETKQNHNHNIQQTGSNFASSLHHSSINKRSIYSLQDKRSEPHQFHFVNDRFSQSSPVLLSDLSQNLLDVKSFDSEGADMWPGVSRIQSQKRNFDSIGNGILSGIGKNYLGKRQFDSISRGSDVSGMSQNYMKTKATSPRERYSRKYSLRQNIFETPKFGLYSKSFPEDTQRFLYKNVLRDILNGNGDTKNEDFFSKRNFDSISEGALNGLQQHFLSGSNGGAIFGDIRRKFRGKRFDAISNGALGGLRQNFLDKKFFDTLSKMSVQLIRKSFLSQRDVDPSSRKLVEAAIRNIYSKRNIDSISHGSLGSLNQNFHSKPRRVPIRKNAERSSAAQAGLFSTDNPDRGNAMSFDYAFAGKRSFDPITTFDSVSGIGQNFVGSFSPKPRRIRTLPWMSLRKRNMDDAEVPDDGEEEDHTLGFTRNSLTGDIDNRINDGSEEIDFLNTNQVGSERSSYDSFVNDNREFEYNNKPHAMDDTTDKVNGQYFDIDDTRDRVVGQYFDIDDTRAKEETKAEDHNDILEVEAEPVSYFQDLSLDDR